MKNIYGYTKNVHPYPEFVSLNSDKGVYTLTVREPAKPGPHSDKDCGSTVQVVIPHGELHRLMEALQAEINKMPRTPADAAE